jgi:hypothetical protein
MDKTLDEIAKQNGFESIESFLASNLHYLSKEKQVMFKKFYPGEYYGKSQYRV